MADTQPYEVSIWIKEFYGSYRILCFDEWEDGYSDNEYEAWEMPLLQEDVDEILEEMRDYQRETFTEGLLADFDSEHYDVDSEDYNRLVAEVENGEWQPIDEFLANNL